VARAVIFANGELRDPDRARALLRADDTILCADGGTHHARALGLQPHTVIGDLDSLSKDEIDELTRGEVQINLFPADKNETDLELALQFAVDSGFKAILIVGATGGRLDQTLSNLALISDSIFGDCDVRMDDGVEEAFFCRDETEVNGEIGDVVSLIPWGGVVGGIRTENLKWQLEDESLYAEESRGISNEMIAAKAAVSISFGLLLIVHRRASDLKRV